MEEILPLAVWGERVVGFVRQGRAIGFGVQPSLEIYRLVVDLSWTHRQSRETTGSNKVAGSISGCCFL